MANSYFSALSNEPIDTSRIRKGVFCDISGSLIIHHPETKNWLPNKGVLLFLRAKKAEGHKIHLISKIEDNAKAIGTGVVEEFGPIDAKAHFSDAVLEYLIDDNPDYLQALNWINPASEQGQAFFDNLPHS